MSATAQASRLEQLSSELAMLRKELDDFGYTISHDLRAPLRIIDGFSEALQEDYGEKLDDVGRDYLQKVREAAQQMEAQINGLLELSRVSRAPMRPEQLDLSALAEGVLASLRRAEPGRSVEASIDPSLVAEGDAALMKILLDQLLGNAWKFTRGREVGHIEVGKGRGEGAILFVRDNGAGFDAQFASRLFQPFQRFHSPAQFEGRGMGLALSQRVAARHGWLLSGVGEPGHGATFSLEKR